MLPSTWNRIYLMALIPVIVFRAVSLRVRETQAWLA